MNSLVLIRFIDTVVLRWSYMLCHLTSDFWPITVHRCLCSCQILFDLVVFRASLLKQRFSRCSYGRCGGNFTATLQSERRDVLTITKRQVGEQVTFATFLPTEQGYGVLNPAELVFILLLWEVINVLAAEDNLRHEVHFVFNSLSWDEAHVL